MSDFFSELPPIKRFGLEIDCTKLVEKSIRESIQAKEDILSDPKLVDIISSVSELVKDSLRDGKRVFFAGNGGSAADAQHLAAEFVSRFQFDRPGLPALSLSTDTSILTAIGNDYGYELLFQRQLKAQSSVGDVFFGLTTSGKSKNIIAAFEMCDSLGIESIALCGLSGKLDSVARHVVRVPSHHTPRIQECHILIGHIICEFVEKQLFGDLIEN